MKFEINDEKLVKFGNFIKKLRFENNYTLEQLKRYTGINIADLNRLENDGRKKINSFHLLALSNIYKINVLDLYYMIGYLEKEKIYNFLKNEMIEEKISEFVIDKYENRIKIPLYSSIKDYFNKDDNNIPDTFIQIPIDKCMNLISFYISNDNMEPTLNKSSIAIFEIGIKNLKNNDIGIFLYNGIYIINRFYNVNNEIILQSDNSSFQPIIIKGDNNFKILGKLKYNINISDY